LITNNINVNKFACNRNVRQQNFTLIEIIVVIAIIMLIAGVSIFSISRMPAGIIMTNTVAKIEKLMVTAQSQAAFQGKQINVNFDDEEKIFYIAPPGYDADDENNTVIYNKGSKKDVFAIDKNIEVTFPDFYEEKVQYMFFSDGSASGPNMILSLKGQKRQMHISPLTGIVFIKNMSNDE